MKSLNASLSIPAISSPRIFRSLKQKINTFFNTADAWRIFVQGSTFVLMLGAVNLVFVLQSDFEQYNVGRMNSTFGFAFLVVSGALFLFKAFYFLFILYRYFTY